MQALGGGLSRGVKVEGAPTWQRWNGPGWGDAAPAVEPLRSQPAAAPFQAPPTPAAIAPPSPPQVQTTLPQAQTNLAALLGIAPATAQPSAAPYQPTNTFNTLLPGQQDRQNGPSQWGARAGGPLNHFQSYY